MTQNEKSKIRAKVIKWVTRLFLILVAIIMLYPLAWNVVSSFKTSTEFLTDPFAWPQGIAWDNYVRAYEKSNLAANIGNSIYVVLETLVIIVICVVPCSYCLVRYKFPGAKLILNIYMAAIFIQATYIMIPLCLQMNKLNLLNSLTALGVLYATMQFPFAIFLLTGFLRSIPRDYEEAAMIDGCGPFRILTKYHCAYVQARHRNGLHDFRHGSLERIPGGPCYGYRPDQGNAACRPGQPVRDPALRHRLGRIVRSPRAGTDPHRHPLYRRPEAARAGLERWRR